MLERIAGSLARCSIQSAACTQRSSAAALASARAISASRPPTRSAQSSANSQSSTHSIEGVLIVSPLKMPSISLPPLVRRKILGSGRGAGSRSSRSTARGLSTSMPCAASPPSAFCQLKVPTSIFAQSMSCAKAAEVASQIERPVRSAAIQSAFGHPHAAGRAVPGEDDVARRIDARQGPQICAIIGGADFGIELELLGDVGDPAGAEALPRQHRHRAGCRAATRSPSPSRRCRMRGRCRAGSRREAAAARACARSLRPGSALPIAPRCERPSARVSSIVGRPARRLGAGAGREIGSGGFGCGFAGARSAPAATASVNVTLLAESSRRVGTAWPVAGFKGECGARQGGAKDFACNSAR